MTDGGDPYRDAPVLPCARCGEPLLAASREGGTDAFVCARGCGVWRPLAALPSPEDLGVPAELEGLTGRCPQCAGDLAARTEGPLRFEVCHEHGAWLDRGTEGAFDELVEAWAARFERIRELTDLLGRQSSEAHEELARRIVALEDAVAALGRR